MTGDTSKPWPTRGWKSPDQSAQPTALDTYGTDLTALAREGKMDPVMGRDDEVRRVIQVLSGAPRTTRC